MIEWFHWWQDPSAWVALASLVAIEIVLGIDNIIFISILVGRVPAAQRDLARRLGLTLAMLSRLALLFTLTWIMRLTAPLFTVLEHAISGRDLILLLGGLFLIWKATNEIHGALEGVDHAPAPGDANRAVASSFVGVLIQIAIIDIVFSLDSVITAVGMVDELSIMVIAVIASVAVMLVAARPIGEFVERHPTIKMLALSFLIMIGIALVAEGLSFKIPKGYIYFAMAFSMAVEMLNIRIRKKGDALRLHKPSQPEGRVAP